MAIFPPKRQMDISFDRERQRGTWFCLEAEGRGERGREEGRKCFSQKKTIYSLSSVFCEKEKIACKTTKVFISLPKETSWILLSFLNFPQSWYSLLRATVWLREVFHDRLREVFHNWLRDRYVSHTADNRMARTGTPTFL